MGSSEARQGGQATRLLAASQQIASTLQARGHAGLRWWSAFQGQWHTTVLFRDRIAGEAITWGAPLALDIASPAVVQAARLLDTG